MAIASDPSSEVKRVMALIAKTIVGEPGKVKVESEALSGQTVIRLSVAPQDLPVMMENDEKVGHSLRNLLAELSTKHKQEFALKIAANETH